MKDNDTTANKRRGTERENSPEDAPTGTEYRDEEFLRHWYVRKDLSQAEVAEMCGVAQRTICKWLNRNGIRPTDNRGKGDSSHLPAKFRTDRERGRNNAYEFWLHKGNWVRVHRLLAVAEYGYDAVVGKDVHHKNGIGWDNRPSNIEVLDHSEHSSGHASSQVRERGRFA